jgi:hypothetical protein
MAIVPLAAIPNPAHRPAIDTRAIRPSYHRYEELRVSVMGQQVAERAGRTLASLVRRISRRSMVRAVRTSRRASLPSRPRSERSKLTRFAGGSAVRWSCKVAEVEALAS